MRGTTGCGATLLLVLLAYLSRTEAFSVTWPDEDLQRQDRLQEDGADKRGGCHGFPCVFSHLGTKASDATIERIKMSILMDCLNDPHCITQGRRKRIPPSKVAKQKLLFGKRMRFSDISSDVRDYDWESLAQALQKRKRK